MWWDGLAAVPVNLVGISTDSCYPLFMVSVPNYFLCIYVFQPEYSQFSKFLLLLVISLHYFKVSKILKLIWPSLIPKLQKRFNLNPEEALAFSITMALFLLFPPSKESMSINGNGSQLGKLALVSSEVSTLASSQVPKSL